MVKCFMLFSPYSCLYTLGQRRRCKVPPGSLQLVVNTIRFHLKNIYHKLQVHNRLLAISAARERKII